MDEETYVGYLKYSGKLVEEGLLDARKSAQALIGFDEAVRFFVGEQVPALKELEYEFPVRIQQGSWQALVPSDIEQWIRTAAGAGLTAYFLAAAKKMADNDFRDIGLKDVFTKSLIGIQWFIKIGKHCGDLVSRRFENVKFRNNNQEIGIPNSEGEYLYVPKEYYDLYVASSPKLLAKIALVIEDERALTIGVFVDGKKLEESVPKRYRYIFTHEEADGEDVLFPELTHGRKVSLEGEVTRGNETSNTVGLKYQDHILTCYPNRGSIVRFKPSLFLKARVTGVIDRADEHGRPISKRPRVRFSRITPLESDDKNLDLFDIDE